MKLSVQNAELKLKEFLENTSEIEVKKVRINLEKLKEDLKNSKSNLSFLEQEQETKISDMEKTLAQKETEYRILQEETKVNVSQINLSPSQKEQELQKSRNSLATLELEYERDKNNFDLNFSKKENEYFGKIEKEYLTIDESLRNLSKFFNKLDELLKIMPNKSYDNSYSIYYSAKNNTYKSESSIYFQKAYSLYKKLEEQTSALKNKSDIKKLIELINLDLEMYTNLSVAGEQIMK
ncbi:MAG: hypothetical protein LBD88_02595 [Candidatus Peribacteria bacterium]|nr:hypothetical protein [Candidatus Peribacteria bacterium]